MDVSFYKQVGLPEPNKDLHQFDVGDHIIQHYKHSFDKNGRVIVVAADKEDLWESIPQYQDQVGPKNVIRMIEAGGDPFKLLSENENNAFYGDVSFIEAKSLNEMRDSVESISVKAEKALADFNNKYGTSLSMAEFLRLTDAGLLQKHVEGVQQFTEEVNNDGEK